MFNGTTQHVYIGVIIRNLRSETCGIVKKKNKAYAEKWLQDFTKIRICFVFAIAILFPDAAEETDFTKKGICHCAATEMLQKSIQVIFFQRKPSMTCINTLLFLYYFPLQCVLSGTLFKYHTGFKKKKKKGNELNRNHLISKKSLLKSNIPAVSYKKCFPL